MPMWENGIWQVSGTVIQLLPVLIMRRLLFLWSGGAAIMGSGGFLMCWKPLPMDMTDMFLMKICKKENLRDTVQTASQILPWNI
ncbi:hypothetical protein IMSAGC013_00990 [Lachnospiraceae bacterium]|nr:hypothetical protein IMSAGC013_00990 [Lachnospiraceae bacterium]